MLAYYVFHGRTLLETKWAWNWPWLVVSVGLAIFMFAGRAWKWLALIRSLDNSVSFGQATKSYLGGMPLGLITPGRLGELSRCLYLPQSSVHNLAGAGRVVLDNWTDFLAVLVWSTLGLAILWSWPGAALGIAMSLVFNQLGWWVNILKRLVSLLPAFKGIKAKLEKEIPALASLPSRDYAQVVTAGIFLFGLEWLQLDFLLRFLGYVPANFLILGGLMALATLANSIQITVAGVGVREALAVLLLAKAGIDLRISLVATFLQFALNLMIPALLGLTVKPIGSLRRSPENEVAEVGNF
jgi:glycosyltransferase 2 family protein